MSALSAGMPDRLPIAVFLLGDPCVEQGGGRRVVPEGCKRLLAFVSLKGGRVDRRHAAGALWPEGSEGRASGNLRSALWRLRGAGIDVLEADKVNVYLQPGTVVDIAEMSAWADRIVSGAYATEDLRVPPWSAGYVELLPGWYDDWVIFERERLRQRMLHALEVLSARLRAAERCGEAIQAAMDAVSYDPLRESAWRVLVEAHLAEGNCVEASRCFSHYRELSRRELGVEPSAAFAGRARGLGRPVPVRMPALQR